MGNRARKSWIREVFTVGILRVVGCFGGRRGEIPERYCGEFIFDKQASIAYWEAQSDWPRAAKDSLVKMAIPTRLRIEAGRVIITDIATGQSKVEKARVVKIGPDFVNLDLHSNFARTSKVTMFQFDEEGFWLLEGTLFLNYRERFKRIHNP